MPGPDGVAIPANAQNGGPLADVYDDPVLSMLSRPRRSGRVEPAMTPRYAESQFSDSCRESLNSLHIRGV
jgi:hypothetical protein